MIDLEYMDRAMDFTLHETFTDLPDFTENVLHKNDMKLVLIFDPAICKEGGYEDLGTGNHLKTKLSKCSRTFIEKIFKTILPGTKV